MKWIVEDRLRNFKFWSGAVDTAQELTTEELDRLEDMFEDLYPEGCEDGEINNMFWFEEDTLAQWLGYEDWEHLKRAHNGEDDDEEEEDDEELDEDDDDEC